jgi:hypothetical protein
VRQFGRIYPLGQSRPTIATIPRKRDRLRRDRHVTSLSSGWAAAFIFIVCIAVGICYAQDLAPRAYVITPLHSNAITLTRAFYDGNINYNGALPVSGATGTYNVEISTITIRSVSLGGRPMSSPRCPTR